MLANRVTERIMQMGQRSYATTVTANHEDAYDSDVDDGPDASIAFMVNFSSAGSPSSSNNISINEEEGIESDNESFPEENTIPYSKHMASNDEYPSGSYLQIPASTFLD
nr:hypothetical protein [Tanacetum cinerariifolium]